MWAYRTSQVVFLQHESCPWPLSSSTRAARFLHSRFASCVVYPAFGCVVHVLLQCRGVFFLLLFAPVCPDRVQTRSVSLPQCIVRLFFHVALGTMLRACACRRCETSLRCACFRFRVYWLCQYLLPVIRFVCILEALAELSPRLIRFRVCWLCQHLLPIIQDMCIIERLLSSTHC